ncbi:MAG: amino acid adenylation domain-containing protein, partial [bacterium]|nr:amino acid adenylation domain-containing protein [bacterium]
CNEIIGIGAPIPGGDSSLVTGPPESGSPTTAIAYVIYTSGSTGTPKGVPITHTNISPLLHWGYEELKIGTHDRALQNLSYFFDWSVYEIFITLTTGASLYLVHKDILINSESCSAYMEKNALTLLHCTPTQYSYLLGAKGKHETLRYLFLGAEKLDMDLLERSIENVSSHCRIFNMYGPTETTIMSSALEIDKTGLHPYRQLTSIPIGVPVANISLHILDKNSTLCPLNVTGELYIGGDAVASGYLNNPELTAERFVEAGWQKTKEEKAPGNRLYKTGDLARRLAGGNIEFMGRIDHQVKIRGYRIELAEIENHLLTHPEIKEAVVIVRQIKGGDKILCAYYVVETESENPQPEAAGIRQYLSQYLPDYMTPNYFVKLEKIPLTPNGKKDQKALTAMQLPTPAAQSDYTPPRDETEKALADIYGEILDLAPTAIGIDDSFFQLGGHSLKATTLSFRIQKELQKDIKIAEVFAHPTIRELARKITAGEELTIVDIEPVEKRDYYDLSYAQRRLWILCQFEEDSIAYNMPGGAVFTGPLDTGAFAKAVQTLVQRHESLRTRFILVDGVPKQIIQEKFETYMKILEIHETPMTEEEKNNKTHQLSTKTANSVFNLEKGPLFRFQLVRTAEDEYVLMYNIHHIVNDGWSQGNIFNEVLTLYNYYHSMEKPGTKHDTKHETFPLSPLKLQYRDYSRWHNDLIRGGSFNRYENYWMEKFADKPNGIQLPYDRPRKAVQTFGGGRVRFTINKEKTAQLNQLNREEDTTLFMVLLNLLNILMYKYSGQEDIIIGAPIANRKHPGLPPLIGFLVNTLVYRCQVNKTHTFKQLLKEVKRESLNCYEYQDYPFDLMVERLEMDRDLSQSPLFNVMLARNNSDVVNIELKIEGVKAAPALFGDDADISKFDLTFFMDDFGGQTLIQLEYNSDLFDRETIERMADNFLVLVENILDAKNLEAPVSQLNIMTKESHQQVTRDFNNTAYRYSSATIQELFENRVAKNPEETAIIGQYYGDEPEEARKHPSAMTTTATYRELNEKANRMAHYLKKEYGVKRNDIIGISMERSIDMAAAILGIIKSGAAYLAVDPAYPRERVLHVLNDSRSELLVIDIMRPELFSDYEGTILNIYEPPQPTLSTPSTPSTETAQSTTSISSTLSTTSTQSTPSTQLTQTAPHKDTGLMDSGTTTNPPALNQPGDILYINYTSGSTGTPNGAMLSHDCLTNLIQWQNTHSGIDCSLRVLQFTSINFCVSFQEIMGTLTSGGQLCLVGEVERQDIEYLMDFLCKRQINILFLPFSYLNFLFNESARWSEAEAFNHQLKHIITAGEQLKITTGIKRFLEMTPHLKLHNHYGSTEMHVVTSYTLDASTAEKTPIPPAGKPIDNIEIFIVDEDLKPVPVGVYGELCVAGSLEILGYINNEALTGEKLVYCPELSNLRLYRSGDIGRWQPNGNIELRGRKDHLVKVRGFRVEPGEIESKILGIPDVRECVVVVKEDGKGEKYLAAYVVADNLDAAWIKRLISSELPHYMMPMLILTDSLPLMPNGKVDRARLPEPQTGTEETRTCKAPTNETEKKLVEIWAELLAMEEENIGIDNNFFELGGHSLKATTMLSRIHHVFDVKIELLDIFKSPVLKEIADSILTMEKAKYQRIEPVEKMEYYPLSPSQKRFYSIYRKNPARTAYNMPFVVNLNETTTKENLEKAIKKLIARHESLRTSFHMLEGKPVQRIHDTVEITIEYLQPVKTAGYSVTAPGALSDIMNRFVRPFDLTVAPLLRTLLIELPGGVRLWIVDMHHIICDGVSLSVLAADFAALYEGVESTPLRVQYKDYAAWRNSEIETGQIENQVKYWQELYAGLTEIPRLELPAAHPRPDVFTYEGAGYRFTIPTEEAEKFKAVGAEDGTTLYMQILAVLNVLFHKYTGSGDIVIGATIANRSHADLQRIIGLFINAMLMRNHPQSDKRFSDFLLEVKKRSLEAFANQDVPIEYVVEQLNIKPDSTRNNPYDVALLVQNFAGEKLEGDEQEVQLSLPGKEEAVNLKYENTTTKTDMTFFVTEDEKGIHFNIQYYAAVYDEAGIKRLAEDFVGIVKEVSANPEILIEELPLKSR